MRQTAAGPAGDLDRRMSGERRGRFALVFAQFNKMAKTLEASDATPPL